MAMQDLDSAHLACSDATSNDFLSLCTKERTAGVDNLSWVMLDWRYVLMISDEKLLSPKATVTERMRWSL